MGKLITRHVAAHLAVTCTFGVMIAGPHLACAGVKFTGDVAADVQYYSNLFDLPAGQEGAAIAPGHTGGDTAEEYSAAVTGTYTTGENGLTINIAGRHYEYENFTYLSHNEYNGAANLTWHFGPSFNIALQYTYNHSMVNFADTLTQQLVVNVDKSGGGTFNFLITPEWSLSLSPRVHDVLTPLPALGDQPAFPDFALHEDIGTVALNYLGLAHISTGVSGTYTDGTYKNIVGATEYHQLTGDLIATYKVSDLSAFNGSIGYTVRDTEPNPSGSIGPEPAGGEVVNPYFAGNIGKASAVTGQIGYTRQLTPKTSFLLNLFREVDSYVAGANALVGTGGELDLKWQADFKINVGAELRAEHEDFVGTVIAQNNFPDRVDTLYTVGLTSGYAALTWLHFGANVTYQDRSSNLAQAVFSGWTADVTVTATVQ